MRTYLLVALGGAAGSCLRYWLGGIVAARWPAGGFPTGTLVINLTGSLAIGFVMGALSERGLGDSPWRLALAVSLLGGYTTFSAFELELLGLVEQRRVGLAALYALASVLAGLVAVFLGASAGRRF